MDSYILACLRRQDEIREEIRTARKTIADKTEKINKLEEERETIYFCIDALEAEYERLELFPAKKEVAHAV